MKKSTLPPHSSIPLARPSTAVIRQVRPGDEKQLDTLEQACFQTDRLSRRRFRHWIKAGHRIFLVAEIDQNIVGYGLVLLHKGTQLARLYSLAVDQQTRGRGIGKQLLVALEEETQKQNKLYMRLEVASNNPGAIALYESLGYRVFRWLPDYYEDHQNALRMQKRIRFISENLVTSLTPWYQQTTDFTCGPAALLMAMSSLVQGRNMTIDEELDIWRQATTIFMTSGHGGCHPVGLGLAARDRGFKVEVYINQDGPLFIDGVRSEHKKEIMTFVDRQFRNKARHQDVLVKNHDVTQKDIEQWVKKGKAVLILISTYRFDGRKAPHWVTVSGVDDQCLYVHDPDPVDEKNIAFDCQYVPIAKSDFDKISNFGRSKLRTSIVISI